VIRIYPDLPPAFLNRALAAIAELALRWDIPVYRASSYEECDLVYSATRPNALKDSSVWIRFDTTLYEPQTECAAGEIDGLHYWGRNAVEADKIDLIGGIWRLLAMLDESQVPESKRDRLGTYMTPDLPTGRRETLRIPLVEEMAQIALNRLFAIKPHLQQMRQPRWPNGKKWILLLTSDVDHIHLGYWKEIAYNLAKFIIRGSPTYGRMTWTGLKYFGDLKDNPYFTFADWADWSSKHSIPVCFYLSLQPRGVPRDIHDVRSSVDNQPVDWDFMRGLAERGFEFGLHPSIKMRTSTASFIKGKQWLEEHLDRQIMGLRHHYLALDWRKPYETFTRQAKAGFEYDTSIGWRDACGFRAGTCLPYQPFDNELDKPVNLLEIPMSVMDAQICDYKGKANGSEAGASIAEVHNMLKQIKTLGGVAVLNWHQESFWNRGEVKGYFDFLLNVLNRFSIDGDCWMTTPMEITKWLGGKCNKLINL